MHLVFRTFLAVLLAHLLADFPLQSEQMARGKGSRLLPYLQHGTWHVITLIAALAIFTTTPVWTARILLVILVYIMLHLGVDLLKNRLVQWGVCPDCAWLFLLDQAIHLIAMLGLVWVFTRYRWAEVRGAIHWTDAVQMRVLTVAVLYVAVIFGGGYLIRYLTRSLTLQLPQSVGEDAEEIRNAGLYIGWLERFLVLTAVLVQSPAMIGLILTGKSIARFPELKGAKFAEYFLIGTFLSISLALVGGLTLLRLLFGTISLK